MINLTRWFFGEIIEIKSHFGYRFNMDFEDSAMCFVKFSSGTVAVINVGWFSQEYALRVDLFGSAKNMVKYHLPPNRLIAGVQILATGNSRQFVTRNLSKCYFIWIKRNKQIGKKEQAY
jgi:predicted dehydrogenase